jgi:hypothetical protein
MLIDCVFGSGGPVLQVISAGLLCPSIFRVLRRER